MNLRNVNWFRVFTMTAAFAAAGATALHGDFLTAAGMVAAALTSPTLTAPAH